MEQILQAFGAMKSVRGLIDDRGMRPGRAVRRAFPQTGAGDVQAIARAMEEGAELIISDQEPEFVRAYDDVHSCMAGMGDLIYRAYRPARVWIAALELGGVIVARALVRNGQFLTAYGSQHYALDALLRACGFCRTEHWLEGAAVAVLQVQTPAVRFPAQVSEGERALEYASNPNALEALAQRYPGAPVYYSTRERAWVAIVRTPRVIVPERVIPACSYEWAPYVDGAKTFRFINEMEAAA